MVEQRWPVLHRHRFWGPNVDLPCASVRVRLDTALLPAADRIDPGVLRDILLGRVRRRRDEALGADTERLLDNAPLDVVDAVAVLAVELQRLFGEHVVLRRVRREDDEGHVTVAYACGARESGLIAADAACSLLLVATGDGAASGTALDNYLRSAAAGAPDDMMMPLLAEFRRRDIPVVRLNDGGRFGRLVRLGHGAHQRRANGTITDATSGVANIVTGSKRQTVQALDAVGVPVPRQALVSDAASALRAAAAIGYPVVVKPDRGTGGKGITAGIGDPAELEGAVVRAQAIHRVVVVEEFIEGEDHRLFVCGGRLVAATQRRRAQVTGDGRHTVRELVAEVNADPRRGPAGITVLVTLVIDAAMVALLARQHLTPESVPEAGRVVLLRSTSNLKSGGTPVDVTGLVHPDNRRMAELAARATGVDIAGVDFVAGDISISHLEQRCGVVEVNISPSVNYNELVNGDRWGVTRSVVELLFPPGCTGRMPLVAVVAQDRARAAGLMRAAAAVISDMGLAVASSDGRDVWLDGRVVRRCCADAEVAATTLLAHPDAGAAVLGLPVDAVRNRGLPWPDCDVAVLDGAGAARPSRAAMAAVAGSARVAVLSGGDGALEGALRALPDDLRHVHLPDLQAGEEAGFRATLAELLGLAVRRHASG